MAKTYNSFGMFAAKRRAKLKAEIEEIEAKKEAKKQKKEKKQPPKLDFNPMAHKKIKLPKYPIIWDDISTNTHADVMKDKIKDSTFRLLCMPPGTGKTAVTIAALGKLQKELGVKIPFIISAPSKVVQGLGWQNTILSWNTEHPDNTLEPILITSVDKLRSATEHKEVYVDLVKRLGQHGIIILDEVHKYKNPTGKRAKQLQKFKHFKKIGLSATPLTNDIIMDSASYLIMADFYDNKTGFLKQTGLINWLDEYNRVMVYNDDGSIDRYRWPYYDTLLDQLKEVVYKPDIDLTELDMPEIKTHIIQLDFDDQLNADMRSLVHAYKTRMFDSFIDYFMEYVDRLHSDKLRIKALQNILTSNKNLRQPLIFYKNVSVKQMIIDALNEIGLDCQVIEGGTSFADIDQSRTDPILIQYQSAAEGIELKNSNATIYYQNQTSYDILKQARGRNVRRGMRDDDGNEVVVNQYHIIAEDPLDRELFNRVRNREEVSEDMLEKIAKELFG